MIKEIVVKNLILQFVQSKKINRFLTDRGFSHESLHITLGFTDRDIRKQMLILKKIKIVLFQK